MADPVTYTIDELLRAAKETEGEAEEDVGLKEPRLQAPAAMPAPGPMTTEAPAAPAAPQQYSIEELIQAGKPPQHSIDDLLGESQRIEQSAEALAIPHEGEVPSLHKQLATENRIRQHPVHPEIQQEVVDTVYQTNMTPSLGDIRSISAYVGMQFPITAKRIEETEKLGGYQRGQAGIGSAFGGAGLLPIISGGPRQGGVFVPEEIKQPAIQIQERAQDFELARSHLDIDLPTVRDTKEKLRQMEREEIDLARYLNRGKADKNGRIDVANLWEMMTAEFDVGRSAEMGETRKRLKTIQNMISILDAAEDSGLHNLEDAEDVAFRAAVSIDENPESAESSFTYDPKEGLTFRVSSYKDPFVNTSFLEHGAKLGPTGVMRNAIRNAYETVVAAPELARMAAGIPGWYADNLSRSVQASVLEGKGDTPEENPYIMMEVISQLGGELPKSEHIQNQIDAARKEGREFGKGPNRWEQGRLRRDAAHQIRRIAQMSDEERAEALDPKTLFAWSKAIEHIAPTKNALTQSLKDQTNWDAPLRAGAAVAHHYGEMWDKYGWGMFWENPLDAAGLASLAGFGTKAAGGAIARVNAQGAITGGMAGRKLTKALASTYGQLGKKVRPEQWAERLAQRPAASTKPLQIGEPKPIGAYFGRKYTKEGLKDLMQADRLTKVAKIMDGVGNAMVWADPLEWLMWGAGAAAKGGMRAIGVAPETIRRIMNRPGENSVRVKIDGRDQGTFYEFREKVAAERGMDLAAIEKTIRGVPPEHAEDVYSVLTGLDERAKLYLQVPDGPTRPPIYSDNMVAEAEARAADDVADHKALRELAMRRQKERTGMVVKPPEPAKKAFPEDVISESLEDLLPERGIHLDETKWDDIKKNPNLHTITTYLAHRMRYSPAMLEELAERTKQARSLRDAMTKEIDRRVEKRFAAKGKRVVPASIKVPGIKRRTPEAVKKDLVVWANKKLAKLDDPKQLRGRIPEELAAARRAPQDPTKHPAIEDMAKLHSDGDPIMWVPASHIGLAKTLEHFRYTKETAEPLFRQMKMNVGGDAISAEEFLNIERYNNPANKEYLEWLQSKYHNVGTLENVDLVYSERLPGGQSVDINQLDAVASSATALRKLLTHGGMDASRAGLLSESSFWMHMDDYVADFYKKHEKYFKSKKAKGVADEDIKLGEFRGAMSFAAKHGYIGHRFRAPILKWALDHQSKVARGLITDARYAVGMGMSQVVNDVHFKKFADVLRGMDNADGTPMVSRSSDPIQDVAGNRVDFRDLGYVQAGRKRLGKFKYKSGQAGRWLDLESTWVHPEAYHYINATRNLDSPVIWQWFQRNIMRRWKWGKTVANPATQVRNFVSNGVMTSINGLNPGISKSARLANPMKTLSEYATRSGPWVDEAMEANVFGSTFTDIELGKDLRQIWDEGGDYDGAPPEILKKADEDPFTLSLALQDVYAGRTQHGLQKMIAKTGGAWKNTVDTLNKVYAGSDEFFKLWRFKQIRILQKEFQETGKITRDMRRALGSDNKYLMEVLDGAYDSLEAKRAAARESHRWFFDYSDVPGWVDIMRKTNLPFITYSYKAIPRIISWINEHPLQAFFWRRAFDYTNFMNEYMYGDPDYELIAKREEMMMQAPAYTRAGGVLLPEQHELKYIDASTKDRSIKVGNFQPVYNPQYLTPLGGLVPPNSQEENIDPRRLLISTPVVDTAMVFANRPTWDWQRGQIWDSEDDLGVKAKKIWAELNRVWMANLTPGLPQNYKDADGNSVDISDWTGFMPGGRTWQKFYAAWSEIPNYKARPGEKARIQTMEDIVKESLAFRLDYIDPEGPDRIKLQEMFSGLALKKSTRKRYLNALMRMRPPEDIEAVKAGAKQTWEEIKADAAAMRKHYTSEGALKARAMRNADESVDGMEDAFYQWWRGD